MTPPVTRAAPEPRAMGGDDLPAPVWFTRDRFAERHRDADLWDQVEEIGETQRKGERHQRPPRGSRLICRTRPGSWLS